MPDNRIEVAAAAPPTIDHLVGQQSVKARVKVALEAAWADGVAFQHALMVGPSGTGKTLTAQLVAREMGTEVKECLAQTLGLGEELEALLLEADDRECIFIDEIHELMPCHQTLLYRAMEERKLFVSTGANKPPKSLPLRKMTVLAATTDEWALLEPLRNRFKLVLRFQLYSVDDLAKLLHQRVHALHWQVETAVFEQIAQRAKGTPRLALRLLESCWRTARSQGDRAITMTHLQRTCGLEELDSLGLDIVEQRLLRTLAESDKPMRLNILASKLGLPQRTVAQVVERYLIAEGLVTKTASGARELTPKGREHLRPTQASTGEKQ